MDFRAGGGVEAPREEREARTGGQHRDEGGGEAA